MTYGPYFVLDSGYAIEGPFGLMTDFHDPSEELDPLESEALTRVRRLGSGHATSREIEDTRQWGRQSAAHADALLQASLLWDRLGPAGRNVLKRTGESVVPGRVSAPSVSRRAMLGGALAASATAYLAVRPPLDLWPSVRDLMVDYRTATGEKRELAVAGGAQVTLNTATSVNVQRRAGDTDRIEIIKGEAAIAVDASSEREVVVIAGYGEASARRAQFDVRHEHGVTCVTCLDGEVRVAYRADALALRMGQQVSYGPSGVEAPIAVDPVEVSAWREGILIFHYRPLTAVVAEINRYRPGHIMVVNAELGRRLVNGRFRLDNVDGIMAMFQQIFGAKMTRLPGGIVLLS